MKLSLLLSLPALVISLVASAAYDNGWYRTDFWSGEYPNGFAVVKKNVSVPARTVLDPAAPRDLSCGLPYLAVFHPWNSGRDAEYLTYSKVVPMKVKKDFVFEDEGRKVALRAGDTIEYLVYGAEGWFTIRIGGEEYMADQSLFDNVEEPAESAFRQDEWVQLTCASGQKAWILLSDLGVSGGEERFADGLDSWFLGFEEYGSVRDLTKKDLTKSK